MMKISFTTLTPFFLSLVLALDQFQTTRAVNFNALDTPLLDSLEGFFCDQRGRDGPMCNFLGTLQTEEERDGQAAAPQGEQMTLRQFLMSTTCSAGLMPGSFCQALGEDSPALVGEDGQQPMANKEGATGDRIVDGFFLNLMCGEEGYAPASACAAIVGSDGDSGLIRTFCESGVITTYRLCGMVGVENPAQPGRNGGGRRMLRH